MPDPIRDAVAPAGSKHMNTNPRTFAHRTSVVEAMQWNPDDIEQLGVTIGWLMANEGDPNHHGDGGDNELLHVNIKTAEGVATARAGDWIVRDRDGFHVDGRIAFQQVYAEVQEADTDA